MTAPQQPALPGAEALLRPVPRASTQYRYLSLTIRHKQGGGWIADAVTLSKTSRGLRLSWLGELEQVDGTTLDMVHALQAFAAEMELRLKSQGEVHS